MTLLGELKWGEKKWKTWEFSIDWENLNLSAVNIVKPENLVERIKSRWKSTVNFQLKNDVKSFESLGFSSLSFI